MMGRGTSRLGASMSPLRLVPLLLLVLLGLGGCRDESERIDVCGRALETLLDAAPTDFQVASTGGADDRLDLALTAKAGLAPHQGSCEFAPVEHPHDRPALRGVVLDGIPLSPTRLVMLSAAVGVPVDLGDLAQNVPFVVPPGRAFPYFIQELLNGLVLGAVLALVAVGYSLVYGVTGTIQFAFGQIYATGALLVILLMAVGVDLGAARGGLLLVGVGGIIIPVMALWGWTIDRIAYRPLRGHGRLTPLLSGIGLAIVLENGLRVVQGPNDKWQDPIFTGRHELFEQGGFPVLIGDTQLMLLALALVVGGLFAWVIRSSRIGRAYRACADDLFMASMLGININRVVGLTSAAGAGLAALAGLIVSVYYGEADAGMGLVFGFKALTAALLGGFGSLSGAVAGGFAIGMLETFWTAYFGYAYRDVAVFAILCLVLVYRPQGIFGVEEPQV
ncbi:MAG: livH2 [Rhodospirillales bacterium]|nr:livH2 [Rhodospirillales bacterium]